MDFSTLQENNLSPDNVQDLIADVKPGGEHRFIDKALTVANERLFTQETGMRVLSNDTLKVCLILIANAHVQVAEHLVLWPLNLKDWKSLMRSQLNQSGPGNNISHSLPYVETTSLLQPEMNNFRAYNRSIAVCTERVRWFSG